MTCYCLREWDIDPNEIQIDFHSVLGQGELSIIYKGTWRGLVVAIKYFNPTATPHLQKFLKSEMHLLTKMHHPHIIQILGVSWKPFFLVLEYMDRGSLADQLAMTSFWGISWRLKKRWSLELCRALLYLHERKPEFVIHRDLKPSNILIGKNYELKISDFGISLLQQFETRPQQRQHSYCVGTFSYMAPEVMTVNSSYNHQIDIWSLGIILYELWEEQRVHIPFNCITVDDYKSHICENGIKFIFYKTPFRLRSILRQCVSLDPHERPPLECILETVASLKQYSCLFCW